MTARRRQWEQLIDAEALGEPLAPDELATQRELEQEMASCRIERELWRELAATPERGPGDADVCALVDRVLAEIDAPVRPQRSRRSAIVVGAAALAAALALAFAMWPRPTAEAPPTAALVRLDGVVEIDGVAATAEAVVAEGAVVQTHAGRACLALADDVEVCLAADSRLVVRDISSAARVLELMRGRAVAQLAKQPEGKSFAIESDDVVVTAIGTVFAVAHDDGNEGVIATVIEGEVAVASAHGEQPLPAHHRAVVSERGVDVRETTRDEEDRARAILDPALASVVLAEPAALPPSAAPPVPLPPEPPVIDPAAPARKPAASASALLERAREQLRAGHRRRAAEAYRELVQAHPRSAEAHAIRVALGDLELGLGHTRAALRSYDRYLADGGGPLDREARLGRIRALAQLGDRGRERAAIAGFLERYGTGSEARKLRARIARLDELDTLDPEGG